MCLRDSVRAHDIAARHGGEEFAIAFPACGAVDARALEGLRVRLDAAVTVAGLPRFTASFGVVDAAEHEDLSEILARADVALFEAKRLGRDRVVVHDRDGHSIETSSGAERSVFSQRGLDARLGSSGP